MKNTALALLFVLLSSFFLAGCTPSTTNTNNNDQSNVEVDFEIVAEHLSFTPNLLEARPGETVSVRVTSVDELHDLVIDELDVNTGLLGSGQSAVVEITIPADATSGQEYEFYCSVGSHRAMGMVGTLRVL
jgi:nitrite reductase (NO-forming)